MKEPHVFRKMNPNVDLNAAVLPGFPSTWAGSALNFAHGQARILHLGRLCLEGGQAWD